MKIMEPKKEIVPLNGLDINLPDDCSTWSADTFIEHNKQLLKIKYPEYVSEKFIHVFNGEIDKREIYYIVLMFWFYSPFIELNYTMRSDKASEIAGLKKSSTVDKGIMQLSLQRTKEHVSNFLDAQQHASYKSLQLLWAAHTKMMDTLLSVIGKSDDEFDQKHVVGWKDSLMKDFPMLNEYTKDIHKRIDETKDVRKEVRKASVGLKEASKDVSTEI